MDQASIQLFRLDAHGIHVWQIWQQHLLVPHPPSSVLRHFRLPLLAERAELRFPVIEIVLTMVKRIQKLNWDKGIQRNKEEIVAYF